MGGNILGGNFLEGIFLEPKFRNQTTYFNITLNLSPLNSEFSDEILGDL